LDLRLITFLSRTARPTFQNCTQLFEFVERHRFPHAHDLDRSCKPLLTGSGVDTHNEGLGLHGDFGPFASQQTKCGPPAYRYVTDWKITAVRPDVGGP